MIAADKPSLSEAYLSHISMKPWSEYTKADYTADQWHRACLIHQHPADDHTSKNQCKLPVRTPNGAINKNGVHAAAAALAGARGGVDATSEQKASARTALVRLYEQLGEDPPPGLVKHSDMDDDEALIHFGRKGMKWGVRKDDSVTTGASEPSTKPKMSTGKKVAIGVTAAAGAASVALLLSKTGRMKFGGLAEKVFTEQQNARAMRKGQQRAQASFMKTTHMKDITQSEWKSRVNAVLADMKDANQQQDKYMRSLGLGAVVNRGD
jgi:hypothetical protein